MISQPLAPANRRSENVGVETVVIAELKLGDVQRQIFGADFVEGADHAALEDRPEAFNRVGVNCADRRSGAPRDSRFGAGIRRGCHSRVLIGRQQAYFVGNHFAHESLALKGLCDREREPPRCLCA